MNFYSGYSRFGTNTVENLSQKTPWPSQNPRWGGGGGGGGTLRKPCCLTFGFLINFDKVLNLCYEFLRFLKSVASFAQ